MFKSLQKRWPQEYRRHQLTESLQACFVAVVWILLFALVLILQACAEKPKPLVPSTLKDMEIKEPTRLTSSEYMIVNRLVFARGGRLITQGADLKIEANEIISDDGVIEPFSQDSVALPGNAGVGGGNISVKAKTGRGTLFLYGRGQNGGPGVTGAPGLAGKPGATGKPAVADHANGDSCYCGATAHHLKWEAKQNFISALMANQQLMLLRAMHRCIAQTGDGQVGHQGGTGGVGGNGGRGGDAARIYVEVADSSALQVKAYSFPGQGGAGGSGGPGGSGGGGGAPGNHSLDHFEACREAAPGPSGPPGDRGLPGFTESSGNGQPICIKLGNTSFGDCEKN